jgi:hypothetical protein
MAQSTRLGTRTSNAKAGNYIANRIGFVGSNFYGVLGYHENQTWGRLDHIHIAELISQNPDYIVYSYGTPIAWHHAGGWSLPAIKYSVSTSKHQSLVRRAIA